MLSKDSWEASAVHGSVYDTPFPISDQENTQLTSQNRRTVSQLFDTEEPRSLNNTIQLNFSPNINTKINNIMKNIRAKQTGFLFPTITKTHSHSLFKDKSINPSHILKKQEKWKQEETWAVAPSRLTRINAGIPVPNIKNYNLAYTRNKISKKQDIQSMITLVNQSKGKPGIIIISQDQILCMRDIFVLTKKRKWRNKRDNTRNQTNNLQLEDERDTYHQSHQKNRTHN